MNYTELLLGSNWKVERSVIIDAIPMTCEFGSIGIVYKCQRHWINQIRQTFFVRMFKCQVMCATNDIHVYLSLIITHLRYNSTMEIKSWDSLKGDRSTFLNHWTLSSNCILPSLKWAPQADLKVSDSALFYSRNALSVEGKKAAKKTASNEVW